MVLANENDNVVMYVLPLQTCNDKLQMRNIEFGKGMSLFEGGFPGHMIFTGNCSWMPKSIGTGSALLLGLRSHAAFAMSGSVRGSCMVAAPLPEDKPTVNKAQTIRAWAIGADPRF